MEVGEVDRNQPVSVKMILPDSYDMCNLYWFIIAQEKVKITSMVFICRMSMIYLWGLYLKVSSRKRMSTLRSEQCLVALNHLYFFPKIYLFRTIFPYMPYFSLVLSSLMHTYMHTYM